MDFKAVAIVFALVLDDRSTIQSTFDLNNVLLCFKTVAISPRNKAAYGLKTK